MSGRRAVRLVAAGTLVLAATACGLKAPLEMPEKSTNVVIRGPQAPAGTTTTPAPTTPGETTQQAAPPAQAPAAPAPATKPAAPPDDRMPPPPLPGGNPGSSRGG